MEDIEASSAIRVGFLIPSMRHGGAERVVARLDAAFRDSNRVRPHVVVFDDSEVGYGMKGRIRSLGVPWRGRVARALQAPLVLVRAARYRRLKSKWGIDVTYSFGDAANLVNILSGGDDTKIVSYRGYGGVRTDGGWFRRHVRRRVTQWICGASDLVVVVSHALKEILKREYGQPARKLRVMHNGYDPVDFPDPDGVQARSLDKGFFLAVGSYRHEKRYDHLLRAFAAADLPAAITLRIDGVDPTGLRAGLQGLARELGVANRVDLRKFIDDPFTEMSRAIAFVLSSGSEGFPNVLVEAMFSGAPVIATDCPTGPREILQDDGDPGAAARGDVERADYGLVRTPAT